MITVDTQVLIWGIRGVATKGQEDRLTTANQFMERIASEPIALTAPVIPEFLAGYDITQQRATFESLVKNFAIFPFDARAARLAAEIDTERRQTTTGSPKSDPAPPRQAVKTDIMILATALVNHCSCVVT